MLNYYENQLNQMPKITIYANCDTALTLNLGCFSFAPQEQLVFIIKNHDYLDAPVEFLELISPEELNSDKNVSIIVPSIKANKIKNNAIYTFMVKHANGQYSKLTPNGTVKVEYGAHSLNLEEDADNE
jgi:hypothetical protein